MADLPSWALKTAEPDDYAALACARRPDPDLIRWPDLDKLKTWARQQGWPVPLFGFKRDADGREFERAIRSA